MTTLVVGGGLIGLTTAWALTQDGESVLLLDAEDGVAKGTSFANAGLITPSMPEPWNGPGVFGHLIASLFDPRSGLRLKPSAIPGLGAWGLKFIAHSTPARHFAACSDNYRLARLSLDRTAEITEALGLEYDRGTLGTLSVFRDQALFEAKRAVLDHVAGLGMQYELLTPDVVVEMVPGLADAADQLICGVHYPGDHHGDAHRFCRALLPHVLERGEARFDERVESLLVDRKGIRGVRCASGEIEAERVVVAAGVHSPALLATAGIPLPVQPAKGYSVTVDVPDAAELPPLPVIDDALHACLTPLGSRLRMVGTAEFAGFDKRIDPVRTDNLIDVCKSLLPRLSERIDFDSARRWAGLRPMSYDGRPFIGETGIAGLYVNSGHGPLGWTMAMGSAALLAAVIAGREPPVDAEAFRLARA